MKTENLATAVDVYHEQKKIMEAIKLLDKSKTIGISIYNSRDNNIPKVDFFEPLHMEMCNILKRDLVTALTLRLRYIQDEIKKIITTREKFQNMNSCSRPCSPSDMDLQGRCKCDREAELFPAEPVESLIRKLKLYRRQFREQLQDEMNRQNFKFIPLQDGLCSLDAAISKFENFNTAKQNRL